MRRLRARLGVCDKMRSGVMSCVAAMLVGAALAANATTPRPPNSVVYDCAMDTDATHNWVAKRVEFAYDAKANTVQVLDSIERHFRGGPVNGAVRTDSDGRTVFDWTVEATDSKHRSVTVRYDATLTKPGDTVFLRETVNGYNNLDVSQGHCVLR